MCVCVLLLMKCVLLLLMVVVVTIENDYNGDKQRWFQAEWRDQKGVEVGDDCEN